MENTGESTGADGLLRILIQNPYLTRGGAESRLRSLVPHLLADPRVGEIHWMCVPGQRWPDGDRPPGLSVHPVAPEGFDRATEALIRQRRIHLVQFHNEIEIGTAGLARAQAMGVPTVWVTHDYWPLCGWRFLTDVFRAASVERCETVDPSRCAACVGPERVAATAARRSVVEACDLGIVPSRRVESLLWDNGLLRGRTRIIDPWVDLNLFVNAPPRPRNPWRVLFAGNLLPHKGVGVLLDAWSWVERWLPAAELLLVADDRGAEEVAARIGQLGLRRVEHHPAVPQRRLADLYRSARLTVVPSLWDEVIGLVWIESLASGTTVVASATGSIPELMSRGGVTLEPGDAKALATVINDLLVTPEAADWMGAEGRADVLARFQPARAATAFVDQYEALSLTARSREP